MTARWVRPVDCMSPGGLPSLDSGSVHMVLTDPPYGIDDNGEDRDADKLRQRTRSATAKRSVVGGVPAVQPFDRRQVPALREFAAANSRIHETVQGVEAGQAAQTCRHAPLGPLRRGALT